MLMKKRYARKRQILADSMFGLSADLRSSRKSIECALADIAEAVAFLLEGK